MDEFNQSTVYVIQGWNPIERVQYRARINKRKNENGEYRVKFFDNGVYMPDADYFTDDYKDAIGTARASILFMVSK